MPYYAYVHTWHKALVLYGLVLGLFLGLRVYVYGQCSGSSTCQLCDIEATVTNVTNATIVDGTSTIGTLTGGADPYSSGTGTDIVLEATGCGEITFDLELEFTWDQGTSISWIHGVSFSSTTGWSSAAGVPPGGGWDFYNSVTGICSGNTYTDGYFFDDTGDDDSSYDWFFDDCLGIPIFGITEADGDPGDNWGVDCETDCPSFEFELTFCPDEAGDFSETVSFFITEDGESGGWVDSDFCNYELNFPVMITAAGVQIPEETLGPDCPGTCFTLDAGAGCDGYLWSTMETTQSIEVCPTEDASYQVTVSIDCGNDIMGEYMIDIEDCCDAEAGVISATPNPVCPGDMISVSISGFNNDPDYTEVYIIVGPDGTIIETGPVSGDFSFVPMECGSFTFVSYNYLTSGSASVPMIGDVYASLQCDFDTNCCDAEEVIISAEDNEAPIISLPATPTPTCYQDWLDNFVIEDATFTDNCLADGTITGVDVTSMMPTVCDGGTIMIEYSITDDCGNINSQTLSIDIPPLMVADWVLPLPELSIDINCGDPVPPANDMLFDNGTPSPCQLSGGPVVPVESGNNPPDNCGDVLIRTWDATDDCGNVLTTLTQTITVVDTELPLFDALPTMLTDLMCDENLPVQETLTGTDNCGQATVSPSASFTEDLCNGYTVTYEWLIEDGCGNMDLANISFEVLGDSEPPTFDDMPVAIPDQVCGSTLPNQEQLSASDNCSMVDITTEQIFTEDICNGYPVTYAWTATDDCDNVSTEMIVFNVLPDTEAPIFETSPIMIADIACDATFPEQEMLVASDNCTAVSIVMSQDFTEDICNGYTVSYSWSAMDECNNEAIEMLMFNVLPDSEPPVFDMEPTPLTDIPCNGSLPPFETLSATDNCSAVSITTSMDDPTIDLCNGYTVVYTWTAEDACSNVSMVSTSISILPDIEAPQLTIPADITVGCNDVPSVGVATATDNCTEDINVIIEYIGEEMMVNGPCDIQIIRTWQAYDDCDNMTSESQVITLEVMDPVWISALPNDVTIQCGIDVEPTYEVLEYSNNEASPECIDEGMVNPIETGELINCGDEKIVSWEYTSPCGIDVTHSITVSLIDVQDPEWVVLPPASLTVTCLDELPVSDELEASDNCHANVLVPFVDSGTVDPCEGGSIIRTWEFTDECGNGPITASTVYTVLPPLMSSCDDLDPCTFNDEGIVDCFGQVCDCVGIPKPEINILGGLSVCLGSSTQLSTDGVGDHEWSTGESTVSITVSFPGTYSVTVIDDDGCEKEASVDVIEDNVLSPVIVGPTEICEGELATLDVGTGFDDYEWSNGGFSNSIEVGGGMYTVTVTDAGGCVGTSAVTVTEIPSPTPMIEGALQICQGASTTLQLDEMYDMYEWSNGLTSPSIIVNEAGEYMVTVTDETGCSSSSSVTVIITESISIDITGDPVICEGQTTELDAGSWMEYLWNTGDTDGSIIVSDGGVYSVTVTDDQGCTGSQLIQVTEQLNPAPTIIGSTSFCEGGFAQLSVSQMFETYAWSDGTAAMDLQTNMAGVYTVTVSDVNGCTGTSSVEVTLEENLQVIITGALTFCEGGSTILDAGENFETYLWNQGDETSSIEVDMEGQYSVTVSDVFGCTGSSTVDVYYADELTVEITGPLAICDGDQITLQATEGFANYSWSDGSSMSFLDVNMAGIYALTVTDNSGFCTGEAAYEVSLSPDPSVEIIGDPFVCEGESATLTVNGDFTNVIWSTGETTSEISAMAGTYEITVSNEAGCNSTRFFTVESVDDPFIQISDIECDDDLQTYTIQFGSDGNEFENNLELPFFLDQDGFQHIAGIPIEQSITIIASVEPYGCMSTIVIDPPNCDCTANADAGENQTIDCDNTVAFLGGSNSSTGPNYSFEWYDEEGILVSTEENFNTSSSGVFTLIVTDLDLDCTDTDAVFVDDVSNEPLVSIIPDPSSVIDCEIESITLSNGVLEPNISYQWLIGNDTIYTTSITVSDSGSVTLIALDTITGCFQEETIGIDALIDYPFIDIQTPDTLNCLVQSVVIDGSNSQSGDHILYEWIDPTGSLIIGDTSNVITVVQEGQYILFSTDTLNGCMNSDTIVVVSNMAFPALEVSPVSELFCGNDEASIEAIGPTNQDNYTIIWSSNEGSILSGQNTLSIDVEGAGWYYISIEDPQNSCVSVDSVFVNVNENYPTDLSFELMDPLCFGDENGLVDIAQVIGGTEPIEYYLDGEVSTDGVFEDLGPGNYQLSIIDANGCEIDTSFEIIAPGPVEISNPELTYELEEGSSIQVSLLTNLEEQEIADIIWEPELPIECGLCLTFTWENVASSEAYLITVINQNGCIDTTSLQIILLESTIDIYIPNVISPSASGPNSSFFPQTSKGAQEIELMEIYDRWGERIFMNSQFLSNNAQEGWFADFNDADVVAGVYVYKIVWGNRVFHGDVTVIR